MDEMPPAVGSGRGLVATAVVGAAVGFALLGDVLAEALADALAVADFEAEADADTEAVAVLPHEGLGEADAAAAEGRTSTVPYSSEPAPTESATAAVSLRGLVKGVLTKDVVS